MCQNYFRETFFYTLQRQLLSSADNFCKQFGPYIHWFWSGSKQFGTLCMLNNFSSSPDFFQNELFRKILSGTLFRVSNGLDLDQDRHTVTGSKERTNDIWASTRENLSSRVCEQHRRRPACASAQSDQRLCYSLSEKNSSPSCEISIFQLVSVAEETGLKLTLSETLKTGYVAARPI